MTPPTATTAAISPASLRLRRLRVVPRGKSVEPKPGLFKSSISMVSISCECFSSTTTFASLHRVLGRTTPVQQAEYGRDEDERGYSREQQPANDCTPERCILLTAVAKDQRHRDHADDHRERCHQHGAEPRIAGFERCLDRVAVARELIASE